MSEAKCQLCGEPMPPGEEMFNYHGYSGPCPKPPLPKATESTNQTLNADELTDRFYTVREQRNKLLCASQKALAAFDTANTDGKSTWSGADVDAMRAAVANCSPEETNADLEEIDPDALLKLGFTGCNDEPDVDVYDLSASNAGPTVRVVIRFSRGEQVASHLMLVWTYHFGSGPGRTTLSYEINDYPTRGEVRRLVESLGIEPPKTAKQEAKDDKQL